MILRSVKGRESFSGLFHASDLFCLPADVSVCPTACSPRSSTPFSCSVRKLLAIYKSVSCQDHRLARLFIFLRNDPCLFPLAKEGSARQVVCFEAKPTTPGTKRAGKAGGLSAPGYSISIFDYPPKRRRVNSRDQSQAPKRQESHQFRGRRHLRKAQHRAQ